MKPTPKQVSFALLLIQQAGLPSDFVSEAHQDIGARPEFIGWPVESWLASLGIAQISMLITKLQKEEPKQ